MTLPPLDQRSILRVVASFAPLTRLAGEAADLGSRHELVAMICYQHDYGHYVAFCRRRTERNSWILFNDLPSLTKGAYDEYDHWSNRGGIAEVPPRTWACPSPPPRFPIRLLAL